MAKIIRAVAGIILDIKQHNNRSYSLTKIPYKILLTSRPKGKVYAGYWEFPGGKIEPNENPISAVIRELQEEIGIEVAEKDCKHFDQITQEYPHGKVYLDLVLIKSYNGTISPLEKQQIHWHDINNKCYVSPLLITTEKILQLVKNYLLSHPY